MWTQEHRPHGQCKRSTKHLFCVCVSHIQRFGQIMHFSAVFPLCSPPSSLRFPVCFLLFSLGPSHPLVLFSLAPLGPLVLVLFSWDPLTPWFLLFSLGSAHPCVLFLQFAPEVLVGDGLGMDLKLSNQVFNSLKQHCHSEQRRSARLHDKKEHSTAVWPHHTPTIGEIHTNHRRDTHQPSERYTHQPSERYTPTIREMHTNHPQKDTQRDRHQPSEKCTTTTCYVVPVKLCVQPSKRELVDCEKCIKL